MGDANQLLYVKQRLNRVQGSVLEVGSKDYGSTVPFRRELDFTGRYIGLDLEPGPGVDVVGDLSSDLCGLEPESFALVICCSVLEHVKRPWAMAANIERLVEPGGMVYVAVPWVWRYHAYPEDYYRFSHRGIMELFPTLAWREPCFATYLTGEFIPINDADAQQICDRLARMSQTPQGMQKYLPYMQVLMLGCRPS
jgi:SAM-dependent methyltransferase